MFDANMRHLPKGYRFIADVWGVKKKTLLYKHGVRRGDVCLCTMLEDDVKNPMVKFHLETGDVVVSSIGVGLFAYHALYLGTVNEDNSLSGFVYERDFERAKELMEKLNGR